VASSSNSRCLIKVDLVVSVVVEILAEGTLAGAISEGAGVDLGAEVSAAAGLVVVAEILGAVVDLAVAAAEGVAAAAVVAAGDRTVGGLILNSN
jgi:hypothetical protein